MTELERPRATPDARIVVADVALAVLAVGSSAVLLKVLSPRADAGDWVFVVLVALPLALRRTVPRTTAALVGLAAAVQVLVGSPVGFHDAAVLVALATVTGWTTRRTGLVVLALAALLVGLAALTPWWAYLDSRLGPATGTTHVLTTLGALVLLLAAWAYGEQTRRARAGAEAVRERAALAEREREQQAELAAAAERARIAREMHDVVVHGLSVMVVQAEGARYALPESAATSREALAQVAQTGRTALGEMRQLLGLLRAAPAGTAAGGGGPVPGLDDLDALVEQARSAGAAVSVRRRGDLARVAPVVGLTAYRVVQEGLTNARRHGGDRVEVVLEVEGEELVVQVHDEGNGGPAAGSGTPGFGLTGLQERVAAVGGRAAAGPAPAGGFTVRACLPLRPGGAS
ncbi:Signal transduction histidine kinase [Microlunatus sagamiharensis]|uniref:histidine kinase n=1 Tax=Microlunatus sagamiharensis TaxID=546874 RepID=A0A1H2MPX5_9ACTN|nr:Signal transduction histidine kinase [Microlunatus sagamiharensis]